MQEYTGIEIQYLASHRSKHGSNIEKDKEERENVVLWKQPIKTLYNAMLETFSLIFDLIKAFYII